MLGGDELSTCAIVLFFRKQCSTGLDIILEDWHCLAKCLPRNESPTRPLSRKIQSERDVSLPPLGQPKSASRQVSNMPETLPFGLDTCCAAWFAKHHP